MPMSVSVSTNMTICLLELSYTIQEFILRKKWLQGVSIMEVLAREFWREGVNCMEVRVLGCAGCVSSADWRKAGVTEESREERSSGPCALGIGVGGLCTRAVVRSVPAPPSRLKLGLRAPTTGDGWLWNGGTVDCERCEPRVEPRTANVTWSSIRDGCDASCCCADCPAPVELFALGVASSSMTNVRIT